MAQFARLHVKCAFHSSTRIGPNRIVSLYLCFELQFQFKIKFIFIIWLFFTVLFLCPLCRISNKPSSSSPSLKKTHSIKRFRFAVYSYYSYYSFVSTIQSPQKCVCIGFIHERMNRSAFIRLQ